MKAGGPSQGNCEASCLASCNARGLDQVLLSWTPDFVATSMQKPGTDLYPNLPCHFVPSGAPHFEHTACNRHAIKGKSILAGCTGCGKNTGHVKQLKKRAGKYTCCVEALANSDACSCLRAKSNCSLVTASS